ncbi:DUF5670 family protein [Albibacterium sp.]|uniref:DUF5670 family protein n=1 Tax=Albibacterium sp. TaxID=2952885 RepID=UPI002CFD3765|nr:DUF5670 family protein [Albibacterium sp.]HUH19263.1 DUF5670 family protein [Albibacterium sp.]
MMRNTLIVIGIILLIFWGIGLIFKVIGVAINALLIIGLFLIVLSLIKGKNKRIDQGRDL